MLGFLFGYKYYKNPANIKIFSNNQLIDEIDLTKDIKMKNMSLSTLHKNTLLYNWYKELDKDFWKEDSHINEYKKMKIPDKIFTYTLDETVVQGSIKIEITNDNSNYANGFMTKWSSFTFHEIFLMPTYYLDFRNYNEFKKKQILKQRSIPNKWYVSIPEWPYMIDDGERHGLLWPNEFRVVKDGKFMPGTAEWRRWEKGGSFTIELPIIEYMPENGLKMLGPINYEQLLEKDERLLAVDKICPLYFNHFNLINTQNETA